MRQKISDSCEGCPIHEEEIAYICCEAPCAIDIKDVDKAEKLIMAWAVEHQEPVYPTWREYIEDYTGILMIDVIDDPIPADIAEKPGLQPKEGV